MMGFIYQWGQRKAFQGYFDEGHVIKGLFIDRENMDNVILVMSVGGEIKILGLENCIL